MKSNWMRWMVLMGLLLSSGMTQAQEVPGYQGRKVSLIGDFSFFSSYVQPNENWNNGILAFNTRFGGTLNIVKERDSERYFGYNYLGTNAEVQGVDLLNDELNRDIRVGIQTHMIGLGWKVYIDDYVAPLGSYGKIGIGYLRTRATDLDDDGDFYAFAPSTLDFNGGFLELTIGNQTMLGNRLLVNGGLQGVYVWGMRWMNGGLPNASDQLIKDVRKRVRDHVNVNATIGVGILF